MSWEKDSILVLISAFIGKLFNDNLPSLYLRPLFKKVYGYITFSFLAMVAFFTPQPKTLSKTQITQITVLVMIIILTTIIKAVKEMEQKKKEAQ